MLPHALYPKDFIKLLSASHIAVLALKHATSPANYSLLMHPVCASGTQCWIAGLKLLCLLRCVGVTVPHISIGDASHIILGSIAVNFVYATHLIWLDRHGACHCHYASGFVAFLHSALGTFECHS